MTQANDDQHPLVARMFASDPPRLYLTPQELADYWAMSPRTLASWRHQGKGPIYTRVGNRALYAVQDVIDYEKTQHPAQQ